MSLVGGFSGGSTWPIGGGYGAVCGKLVVCSDPPMATDTESSVGMEGRIDSVLEERAVGKQIVEPDYSPNVLTVLRWRLLLVTAALRRKYSRCG